MSTTMGKGEGPQPVDPLVNALNDVADAADASARDSRQLAKESRLASREHARGASVRKTVESGRPATIFGLAGRIAKLLLGTTGSLRRVMVHQASSEGERVSTMSRMLGVSHQRISTLMRARNGKNEHL
jgi:hypothetical protein